jgi:hypothetical protein
MKVNKDTDFDSQKSMLSQGYLKSNDLNKMSSEYIKDENFLNNLKELFESTHVQNNHFEWKNSGSKYTLPIDELIEEIKNSELRPKGKITTLGPTGKEFTSQLTRVITKNIIGTDYSMSEKDENEAIQFYNNNKEIIDEEFNNLKEGLINAIPILKNGKIIYYLENGSKHQNC